MISNTENIVQLIESLGGLHDAALLKFLWRPADLRLEIGIDDLHANFAGLPEYQGLTRATLVFSNVSSLNVEADLAVSGLMIYDWKFLENGLPAFGCEISFSPGGRVMIKCGGIECVQDHTAISEPAGKGQAAETDPPSPKP